MQQACMDDVREPKCSMPGPGSAPAQRQKQIVPGPGSAPLYLFRLGGCRNLCTDFMDIHGRDLWISMLFQPSLNCQCCSNPPPTLYTTENLSEICREPVEHPSNTYRYIEDISHI